MYITINKMSNDCDCGCDCSGSCSNFTKQIDNILNTNDLILLKFDNENSKYDEYLNTIEFKVINITDPEIIEFYQIDTIPTILIYKNKNLLDSIEGFHTKSVLLKKILRIMEN